MYQKLSLTPTTCERRTSGPVVGVAGRKTHLVDLEPALLVADSAGGIRNLGKVDVDGTEVISLYDA